MAAQAAEGQVPPQADAQAIAFSLSPARATDTVIDYSTKSGSAIWSAATEALSKDEFDCVPDGLRDFLELVQIRGGEMGWHNSVLSIPNDPADVTGSAKDLVESYGSITMEHLRTCAQAYVNTQTRVAQDSFQLYTCLVRSLSKTGRDKVTLHKSEYTIGGQPVGSLFLKVIIRESAIDTNATALSIRTQLSEIDKYIAKVDFDVEKTNQHINMLMESLRARGETTHDLLNNLFKAYKTVKDREFVRYITQKESDYEERSIELTPAKLMVQAQNKYKTLVEKGEWCASSDEADQIVALKTQIDEMKKKVSNFSKKSASNRQGRAKGRGQTGKGRQRDRKNRNEETWKFEAPKEGEPKTKTVKGKEWHWCTKHKRWTRHTDAECEGIGFNPKSRSTNQKQNRNPRLVRAEATTIRFADDESSDEE